MAYYLYDSQLDAFTLYDLIQEERAASRPSISPALPALGHAISGSTGTAISRVLIYPLDLVITRLQVQKQLRSLSDSDDDDYKGVRDALEKIYKQEGGFKAIYSGCSYDTAKSIVDSFLFFLSYSFLRSYRQKVTGNPKSLPMSNELLVGMIAGAFSKFFTTPMQNIVTRKQTAAMVAARQKTSTDSPELTTRDIALQIMDEKGITGFWSGYGATLVLTLNPALTFLLHEAFLRTLVPKEKRSDPGAKITFLIAAVSKAIASSTTYPFSLAKTRTQASAPPPEKEDMKVSDKGMKNQAQLLPAQKVASEGAAAAIKTGVKDRTVFATIYRIARTEGIGALYHGLPAEVLRGFFAHGITMLTKERIHKGVIQLYYMILKALDYPTPEELARQRVEKVKQAMQPYGDKTIQMVQTAVKQTSVPEPGPTVGSQVAVYRSQEELDELCERGMQHARDILWGIVDDDDYD